MQSLILALASSPCHLSTCETASGRRTYPMTCRPSAGGASSSCCWSQKRQSRHFRHRRRTAAPLRHKDKSPMSASREDLRAIMNRRRCGSSLTLANREHRVKSRNGFAQCQRQAAPWRNRQYLPPRDRGRESAYLTLATKERVEGMAVAVQQPTRRAAGRMEAWLLGTVDATEVRAVCDLSPPDPPRSLWRRTVRCCCYGSQSLFHSWEYKTMPKTKGGTARLQLGSYHLPSHLRFLGFFQWKGAPRAGHTSIQASAAFNIRSLGLNPGSICPRIIALRNSEPPRRG